MHDIPSNFIKTIMENDIQTKKHSNIITRFPPEPNGFLHIGHARAIIINFELAKHFGGQTNLRFDDTNPEKEDDIFVQNIIKDIEWLGYTPNRIIYASDYFEEMYHRAMILIKKGLAYVDESSPEDIKSMRGSTGIPGKLSPYRERPVEENIELFEAMKRGEKEEGSAVLRAKIDMSSPNMNMRDPVMYRISYDVHHHRGNDWCIYPMYDFAHPLEDAIEGITHSLCSLEFEDHRPLYDWFVKHCEMPLVPRQIEFGRLNIENTVMSKRYLRALVEEGKVTGWDDPRMPTLKGLRRRGYTPNAIKAFILNAGLSKINSTIENTMLDAALRDDLNVSAPRLMAIKDPLKVIITNYPSDDVEYLDVELHQDRPELGSRRIAFSKEIYIEKEDFIEVKPNKKYKRLYVGGEVRLFHAYFIQANRIIYKDNGDIDYIEATYDPETKSGSGFEERKPNGTIHFVDAKENAKATFNIFSPMILDEEEGDFLQKFKEDSWKTQQGFVESYVKTMKPEDACQFKRLGFYVIDKESKEHDIRINEIVTLKGSKG
jgi:glutaminyl-tRNA synthetase